MAPKCKCCFHPGVKEINLMLGTRTSHTTIIEAMKRKYPAEIKLTSSNLSNHYSNHLLNSPVLIDEVDETTGELKEAFIVSHLSQAPLVSKEAIPDKADRVSVPDAIAVILNVGTRKALEDPSFVTPAMFVAALEMARKGGFNSKEDEEAVEAWTGVNERKKASRKKVTSTRTVTVEEEIEVQPEKPAVDESNVIDAEYYTTVDDLQWPVKKLPAQGESDGNQT